MSANFSQIRKTIVSFSKLELGWDGYQGEPINDEVINFAIELIPHLPKQTEAFPLNFGAIQLECENDGHDYFELVVMPNRILELFIVWSNGEPFQKTICYDNGPERSVLFDFVAQFQRRE